MKPDYAVYIIMVASANYCIRERGRINETDYPYSIISPPILVAKPNQQKGGVSSSMVVSIGAK